MTLAHTVALKNGDNQHRSGSFFFPFQFYSGISEDRIV